MEKDKDKRPGKCESCGLVMPNEQGKFLTSDKISVSELMQEVAEVEI